MLDHYNILLFQLINSSAGNHPVFDLLAVFLAEGGPYILVTIFGVFWLLSANPQRIGLFAATEATLLGLLFNQLIGLVYSHPRPFMMGLGTPLIQHVPEISFPSDHATFLFTASIFLLFDRNWRKQGLILFCFAQVSAWSRVYAGIHFPFDILGSMLVAMAAAALISSLRLQLAPFHDWLVLTIEKFSPGRGQAPIIYASKGKNRN